MTILWFLVSRALWTSSSASIIHRPILKGKIKEFCGLRHSEKDEDIEFVPYPWGPTLSSVLATNPYLLDADRCGEL